MKNIIQDIEIFPQKKFVDERGMVLHVMKCTSPWFEKFGEVYFSVVNPGVVKGWKLHKKMTQHFIVPVGELSLVLFDDREESSTRGIVQEIKLSLENYQLVKIPPRIWYAIKATSSVPALLTNCADITHDPEETINLGLDNNVIPYKWQY